MVFDCDPKDIRIRRMVETYFRYMINIETLIA